MKKEIIVLSLIIALCWVSYSQGQNYIQSSGTITQTGKTYTSSTSDISAVEVTGGTFTLSQSTISSSGATTSSDSSSFYGLNAGVLAFNGSSIIILDSSNVTTTGTGANGVFAFGTGNITVIGDTINCSGQFAHGIMCSGGGKITATNLVASTTNMNGAVIATDRGGGTINVTGGTYSTSGTDSPGIYSTGVITVQNATVTSNGAEASVIEGSNSIVLTNVILSGSGPKRRGVVLMQSMSGDAEGDDAVFTMTGGSLSQATGPLFLVSNAAGHITLNGVTVTVTSDTLIKSAADQWGTTGSNGGFAWLFANGQSLTGNVVCDNISKVRVILTNSSHLTGAVNTDNTALLDSVVVDATSTWALTANSYVSYIVDPLITDNMVSNITGNGFNVYYNSSLNSSLGGLNYSLLNGGCLLPVGGTCSSSGIDNNTLESNFISLYPNPAKDNLTIETNITNTEQRIEILNLVGQTVYITNINNKATINTSAFPSGVYILKLYTDKETVVKKFVKE